MGSIQPAHPSSPLPLRGAYYFPWYPEGWDQFGYEPFTIYTPTLGAYYDQGETANLEQHLAWAQAAGIDVLIPTWRGRADQTGYSAFTFAAGGAGPAPWSPYTHDKIAALMDLAPAHGVKVAILYEIEAYGDPEEGQVAAELAYLTDTLFAKPAYCYVDGRPVVFVYTGADHSDALASKYSDATDGFTTAYVMMQTATDPSDASPQPDGWFAFNNSRETEIGNSFTIVPGFERIDGLYGTVARDLPTWEANIANMVASGKGWQLINSFNEWGEGSQVEPSVELGTDYLDALA